MRRVWKNKIYIGIDSLMILSYVRVKFKKEFVISGRVEGSRSTKWDTRFHILFP